MSRVSTNRNEDNEGSIIQLQKIKSISNIERSDTSVWKYIYVIYIYIYHFMQ